MNDTEALEAIRAAAGRMNDNRMQAVLEYLENRLTVTGSLNNLIHGDRNNISIFYIEKMEGDVIINTEPAQPEGLG